MIAVGGGVGSTSGAEGVSRMLTPAVTAHVGASETGLYPAGVFKSLMGSQTRVYPVNPNRQKVLDRTCYASVKALPERPDLVVITVARKLVPGVLRECVDAGVPSAVVISAGFAEADAEGAALQREIEKLSEKIVILGPNCAGFANLTGNVVATRLYASARLGGVSFVSQSGALMMALHASFAERGVGMRLVASVGNQAGLTVESFLEYFVQDPGTRVCGVFLEGIRDGERFVQALGGARAAGKPVVLVKAGRTEAGARLAATHTAAIAGEDRIFAAICRQFGVILVDDVDELVDTCNVLDALGEAPAGRIACVTQSGGLGTLAADFARREGVDLPDPVDLQGEPMRGTAVAATLEPFFQDKDVGLVLLLFAKNPTNDIERDTVKSILGLREKSRKPVVTVWVGQKSPSMPGETSAVRSLAAGGVPVFETTGAALRAIARAARYRRQRSAVL